MAPEEKGADGHGHPWAGGSSDPLLDTAALHLGGRPAQAGDEDQEAAWKQTALVGAQI